MRVHVAGLAGLAAAVVVAGCDGGSSSSKGSSSKGSSSKGSSSRSSFVSKADKTCQQESAMEVAATRTPITSRAIAASQVKTLIAYRQDALRQLRALKPSAQEQSSYQAFLAQYPAVEAAWRAGQAKAASSFPSPGYNIGQDTKQATRLRDRAATFASRVGLSACAGKLPAGLSGTLTTEIRNSQLHPTASLCTSFSTPRFVIAQGGMKACLDSTKTYSTTATVSDLRGTLPQAVALLTRSGGNQSTGKLLLWFIRDNGRWLLDDAASG